MRVGRSMPALLLVAIATALMLSPGTPRARAEGSMVLKLAVIAPRTPELAAEEKKYNKRLAELTQGRVQVRVYWGGAAGDDQDVLRKMRAGQLDGSPLGLDVLSQFVRECLVLQTPGLFRNYAQVDAVRAALTPEFDAEAYRQGFKTVVWGDIGRLRLFSKRKIVALSDLASARPWLHPASEMLREFYHQVGATGIPLSVGEVFGGMKTGMIDTFWSTAAVAAALQWHSTAKFISADGLGFLNGALVLRRQAWEALPDAARKAIDAELAERVQSSQLEIRKADDAIFQRLLSRGYTAVRPSQPAEWWAAGRMLRRHLVGRAYSQALVDRVEQLALKYADKEQLSQWGK
jgi:TRAP-type C4-dicarboxylate transport system substrate-binding protein